jgi:hypothetical protein
MTFEEAEAERERKRVAAYQRRQQEKALREAAQSLRAAMDPKPARSQGSSPKSSAATQERTMPATSPGVAALTGPGVLKLAPVSPRVYVRAGKLAGFLQAYFDSAGSLLLFGEEDARAWLRDTPIADSIVREELAVAGFQDAYEVWASAVSL